MYRTVETSFWSDPKIRNLSRDGRLLMLYLVTNSHTHVAGIYYVPLPAMEVESGIKGKALAKALGELSDAGIARFDHERSVVFIQKMFKHQGIGPKTKKAAAKQLTTLHGSPLIAEFAGEYPEVAALLPSGLLDRVLEGYPQLALGTGTGTGTGTEDPSGLGGTDPSLGEEDKPPAVVAQEELAWREQEVWKAHLAARQAFLARESGRKPTRDPIFDDTDVRRPIREALRRFDVGMLGPDDRERWKRESRVRASGIGIFYDPWMTGSDPDNTRGTNGSGKRYLEPWRPWRQQQGKAHPVLRFADLYFAARDKSERAATA